MAQDMVWLSGLVSYSQGAAIYERIGQRLVSRSSLWQRTEEYGERLVAGMKRDQEHVSLERVKLTPSQGHRQPKGISLDGGMVNIRGEGWKEMKIGAIFDLVQCLERDPETRELVERPHGVNAAYTAVLGSAQEFSPELWRLAVEQRLPEADVSCVTADGAEWIWNLVAELFPDSIQIVDWFHACQHLAQAASVLFANDPLMADRWLKQRKNDLFQGAVHLIIQPLMQSNLASLAHYFQTHLRRMQYLEFREEGFPIGSGTIESLVKQFKVRLTGPGMRWSRSRAQHMLVIRAAVLAHRFDDLWLRAVHPATN